MQKIKFDGSFHYTILNLGWWSFKTIFCSKFRYFTFFQQIIRFIRWWKRRNRRSFTKNGNGWSSTSSTDTDAATTIRWFRIRWNNCRTRMLRRTSILSPSVDVEWIQWLNKTRNVKRQIFISVQCNKNIQ